MLYRSLSLKSFLLISAAAFTLHVNAQTSMSTEVKINSLIKKMTVEEKVNMVHASSSFTSGSVPRLGIPEWVTSDGPHAVRLEHGRGWTDLKNVYDSGTYLPVGVCLAATWNPRLGYNFGSVLGSEANFRGKDVILGPGINIIRSPLNGRNFEYQSEDPYLISKMVVGYIKGVQDQGISACVKHYAANNIETKRTSLNVNMSERALHEIYLPGFKAAVTEGNVNTIMGSYNKFRGQWASQNYYLLTQILRRDWGFKGVVISDWGAVHNTHEAFWNGCDLEMGTDLSMLPHPDYSKFFFGDTLLNLVKSGKLDEKMLDEKVRRILSVMYKTNMIDGVRKKGEYNTKAHQQTALKVAEEGIVLLKNGNKILPLSPAVKSIAVIGFNADRKQAMGGGSSQAKAFYEVTPLEGLRKAAGNKLNITYNQGYKIERGATADRTLLNDAVSAASKADIAIVVCGWTHGYNYTVWKDNAYDAEDADKPDMLMPFGQDELIKVVLKANPKTIVVLMGGGAIDMTQWVNNVPAILQAWYPGMEGGNALAKIIFGQVNPSGKLPMTFPKTLEDAPSQKMGTTSKDLLQLYYTDDIYVGYRYFDTYKVEPQFAFGHGLSYTTFDYGNLKVQTGEHNAIITFTLKNTGSISGAEVAQVYIKQEKSTLPRPEKELKAFDKIFLKPGESKLVKIVLDENAFHYYSDIENKWVMENGVYDILIGSSSRMIKLNGKIKL